MNLLNRMFPSSQHGWELGEHSEWCKRTNFEIGLRVPYMIRSPRHAADSAGKSTKAFAESLDFYRTLVGLAAPSLASKIEPTVEVQEPSPKFNYYCSAAIKIIRAYCILMCRASICLQYSQRQAPQLCTTHPTRKWPAAHAAEVGLAQHQGSNRRATACRATSHLTWATLYVSKIIVTQHGWPLMGPETALNGPQRLQIRKDANTSFMITIMTTVRTGQTGSRMKIWRRSLRTLGWYESFSTCSKLDSTHQVPQFGHRQR